MHIGSLFYHISCKAQYLSLRGGNHRADTESAIQSFSPIPFPAAPPGACQQEIPKRILIRVERVTCWWELRAQPCLRLLLTLSQVWLGPTEHKGGLRWIGSLQTPTLGGPHYAPWIPPVPWGSHLEKCPFAESNAIKEKPLDGWSWLGLLAREKLSA